jgi:hypothetical protein
MHSMHVDSLLQQAALKRAGFASTTSNNFGFSRGLSQSSEAVRTAHDPATRDARACST